MPEESWRTAHETCIQAEAPELQTISEEVTDAVFAQALSDA
jgi:hypothetical protein